MKRCLHYLLVLIAGFVLTLASGAIHGELSQRWGPPGDLLVAADRLQQIPQRIGPWQLKNTEPLTDEAVALLRCAGYINYVYRHEQTGDRVNVSLLLGPAGPISVHTPEVCFASRDYDIDKQRQRVTLTGHSAVGGRDEFWAVTMRTTDLDEQKLRVYYAWSHGTVWQAAAEPRVTYAGFPFLYKVQVVSQVSTLADDAEQDAGQVFLRDFCSATRKHLVDCSRPSSLLGWKQLTGRWDGWGTETAGTQ